MEKFSSVGMQTNDIFVYDSSNGGAGFIASYFVQKLNKEGYNVVLVDDFSIASKKLIGKI